MIRANIPLLLATLAHLEAHPELHNQGSYLADCNSACCFAGWALALWNKKEPRRYKEGRYRSEIDGGGWHQGQDIRKEAQRALQLNNNQVHCLFGSGQTLADLGRAVEAIADGRLW